MKKYIFDAAKWNVDDFMYVGTAREDYRSEFVQEGNCICNPQGAQDFVSIVPRERLASGAALETTCSFEGAGAPLIVLSDDICKMENGWLRYGAHFEVVIYKGGCNVWRIDLIDGKAKSQPVIKCAFPVAENTPVKLRAEFGNEAIRICAGDVKIETPCPGLPVNFHAGITGCEGVCRFYDLVIE